MKVTWSPRALDRAYDIVRRIEENDPLASERWVNGALNKTKVLENFPSMGRVVPEINDPTTRELIYGDYRIIYRYDQQSVEILTVRHSKQLLSEEEITGYDNP